MTKKTLLVNFRSCFTSVAHCWAQNYDHRGEKYLNDLEPSFSLVISILLVVGCHNFNVRIAD